MKFVHSMIRVTNIDETVAFFVLLGLKEIRRKDNEKGRFTLVFMATDEGEPEIELTYNWDVEERYSEGRNFGHLAFRVDNIYQMCSRLQDSGTVIHRPPRDGAMAFIRTPDNISIELLQQGSALPPQEPWQSMTNTGHW